MMTSRLKSTGSIGITSEMDEIDLFTSAAHSNSLRRRLDFNFTLLRRERKNVGAHAVYKRTVQLTNEENRRPHKHQLPE